MTDPIEPSTDVVPPAPGTPRARGLGRLLPLHQRKTADELRDDLDLASGDTSAKQSRFWIMLVLAAVIAAAGVIGDSTATVIGAMIIAPLATPIMGLALGIVLADRRISRSAFVFVLTGTLVVITIGVVASLVLPSSTQLLANPQISGRTSPTLFDLIAAIATGFAGAVGLVRKDVSDVLPGVAIAISLVPPLAVVGICIGQGSPSLAVGAFTLFLSNVLAMVLAGTLMFAVAFGRSSHERRRTRSYAALGLLLVVVLIPLAANTATTLLLSVWTSRIQTAATTWLDGTPGAQVLDVTLTSDGAVINVLAPGDLPPSQQLLDELDGKVPAGIPIVVDGAKGERQDVGTTG